MPSCRKWINESRLRAEAAVRSVARVDRRTAVQAAMVAGLGLLVFAVVIGREIATAERVRRENPEYQDFCSTPLPAYITREHFERLIAYYGCFAPSQPRASGDPAAVRRSLPQGSAYDVTVHGGIVAPLQKAAGGDKTSLTLAYAFAARYRRTIESNDGYRIVERRDYGTVRMVKILTPVSDLRLRQDAEGVLHGLPSTAAYQEGIQPISLRAAAEAILDSPSESLLDCGSGRAFSEFDPFSGKSVRITYEDGAGVVGVEPLGWAMTMADACQSFRAAVLLPVAGGGTARTARSADAVPANLFADLMDPSIVPGEEGHLLLREQIPATAAPRPGGDRRSGGSGAPDDLPGRGSSGRTVQVAHRLRGDAPRPMGTLCTDDTGLRITRADLDWPFLSLLPARERLFFETELSWELTVGVRYRCVPVARLSAPLRLACTDTRRP